MDGKDKAMIALLKLFAAMAAVVFVISDYMLARYDIAQGGGISGYYIGYIILQLFLMALLIRYIYYGKGLSGGKRTVWGVVHLSGLPIAQGAICRLVYDKTGMTIEAKGSAAHIEYDAVDFLGTRTEKEVETTYSSSVIRAMIGGALFGLAGTIAFGMPKKQQNVRYKMYYEIVYRSGGETKRLLFKISSDMLQRINILNSDIKWRSGCRIG